MSGPPADDTDAQMLRAAGDAVIEIDVRYRLASFADKLEIGPERDRAYDAYSAARLKLLADGTATTAADVAQMRALRDEVASAANKAALINAAAKIAGFLVTLV